jgi:hypothetical protein
VLVSQEEKDRGCDTEHQQTAVSIIEKLHTRKNAEYELINHDDNVNHAELNNHDDSYSAGSLGTCSSLDEANILDKTRKSSAEDGKEKESSSKEDVSSSESSDEDNDDNEFIARSIFPEVRRGCIEVNHAELINRKKLLDKTRKSSAEDGKEKESSSKEDVANADYEGVDKGLVNENKSGTEDGNERVTSPSDEDNDSSSESSDEDKTTDVGSSVSEKVEVVSYFCLSTSFA